MAVSLLCKDCNTLLKNIAEAQSHSDATGTVAHAFMFSLQYLVLSC